MKVKVTTANGKLLGNLVLNQRPWQGEYISISGNVYQIDKIVHEQNANYAFTIQVKVSS
jgi:hypothetical protein